MKSKEVLAKYEKVINEVNKKVKHVNRGGCGIFALELGNVLKQNKIKFKYIMLFRHIEKTEKDYFKTLMENNMVRDFNSEASWTHIVVKVGRKFIDGEEITNKPKREGLEMNEEFLLTLINQKNYWNSMFDRKQKQTIKKILEKHLVV
jgi:phosphomannomutase